jgi:hypothetical protein
MHNGISKEAAMKTIKLPALGIACLLAAPLATAEQEAGGSDTYAMVPHTRFIPLREYPSVLHQWVADLEKAGIYNRALPTPYRVALPLVTFGNQGPTLMFTYAHTLPGSAGSGGPMLFINIPTP